MKKTIIKELLFIMLLTVVIVLTLRMAIYDFIPNENTLPKSIQYNVDSAVETTLNEIQKEENNNIKENSKSETLLKSYIIEETDLIDYIPKSKYTSGKTDPFSDYNETNKSNR